MQCPDLEYQTIYILRVNKGHRTSPFLNRNGGNGLGLGTEEGLCGVGLRGEERGETVTEV